MDEKDYIVQIIKGNEEAFQKLYELYSSKVYNTIISYTKNEEDAEEVLQDVFVTIYNSASTFRLESSVSTWIYRIAVNKSLDFLRKKNSTKRFGIFTSLYKKDSGEIIHESVDFIHPGIKLENKEDSQLLFKAMDSLPENQKTAFILTQIEGLSQQDAADIMKVSRKAVESLLQRSKANLKKDLEKYYPNRGKSSQKSSN